MSERLADLMRQGFMKPPRQRKNKAEQPIIACERCQNWHRKGRHTAPVKRKETIMTAVYETKSIAIVGLTPHAVSIKASAAEGPRGQLTVRGIENDAAVRETRLRVQSSLAALGYVDRPAITVDIALPPRRSCDPSAFDLAIAIAVLGAAFPDLLVNTGGTVFIGALSLDGKLRPVRGALPAILGTSGIADVSRVLVPTGNRGEAAIATTWRRSDVPVYLAPTLHDVIAYFHGKVALSAPPDAKLETVDPPALSECAAHIPETVLAAFSEAIRANKSVLLIAAPGAGKTMLARRAGGLLPPVDLNEAFGVATIQSAAGLIEPSLPVLRFQRPFRAPHHTVSEAGLIGGGNPARPGEVSLAHGGVLFLDEASEFRGSVLASLMTTLRAGEAHHRDGRFPAKPLLILAANPCPCGGWGGCKCKPAARERYTQGVLAKLRAMVDVTIEF